VTATAALSSTVIDPNPSNNTVTIEIDVTDKNDF